MYYVYENWQAGPHKAVIHRASCAHCNDGRGRTGDYDPAHGDWHGPFATLELARTFQRAMVVIERSECGHCMKTRGEA